MNNPPRPPSPVPPQQEGAALEPSALASDNRLRPVKLHTVKGGGGLELCVAESGNPQGPAVLLVHGFCQSYQSWLEQLQSALALDFRLVALDLRGHGGSQKPAGAYTDGRAWAEDLHAVITTLGLKRPVLVGWSYGGVVLTDYLRHYGQEQVAGVHFVGALSRMGRPEFFADFGAEFLRLLPLLVAPEPNPKQPPLELFLSLLSNQALTPQQRSLALSYNTRVPHHVRLGIGQRVQDSDELLRALKLPVLVSHGLEDKVVLPATSRHIAALVPQAELSLYPGVGHSPFWEDVPRFNRELARFVERCAK